MKSNTEPLQPDFFYHIYNRGINGQPVFFETRNYVYFLRQSGKYIEPIAHTYAYCLLGNHFHFLIRIRSEQEVQGSLEKSAKSVLSKGINFYLSNQFAKLFNSYTQSINKAVNRTGGLFESQFRRKEVSNDAYLTQLIWYIHYNPQKHGIINDYKEYKHSSFQSHLMNAPTKLMREEVLSWFGGKENYIRFHQEISESREIEDRLFDFE